MKKFVKVFFDEVSTSLSEIAWEEIAAAAKMLHTTYEQGGYVYLIGNGGSAAIASHFASDLNKTVFGYKGEKNVQRFQAISLPDNTPNLTAWANDVGFESVYVEQLKNFVREKDVVVAISSSGNSQNIIRAVEMAKRCHVPVIGLVGFDGGLLKKIADVTIHVKSYDYGAVESLHQVVIHLLTRYLYEAIKEESGGFIELDLAKRSGTNNNLDIKPLLSLMREVGQKLLAWQKDRGTINVRYKKKSKEVVSELDKKTEKYIKSGLDRILPNYGFLGEEYGAKGNQKGKVIIVDPIDGTKNYLVGSPLFATQIAGIKGNDILWGIVYLPALDEMYWAIKGGGAYLNSKPIKVSEQTSLDLAVQCFGLGHDASTIIKLPSVIKRYLAEPRSLGSAGVHLVFTACGRIDIYIAKEAGYYDIAPGAIICREAGGVINNFGNDANNIIVGNPVLVKKTMKIMTSQKAAKLCKK